MQSVEWIDAAGAAHVSEVDFDRARHITPDVDGDFGASVAGLLALADIDLKTYASGDGPHIEIRSPESAAGLFQVLVTRSIRVPDAPAGQRLVRVTENGDDVRLRVLAFRELRVEPRFDEVHKNLMEMTPSDQVENSFTFLDQVYGRELIEALYPHVVLEDLGVPVQSKITGLIGFLASADGRDGLSDETRRHFREMHGLVPQLATNWNGQGSDRVVCFIPATHIKDGPVIVEELREITRPVPTR